MMKEITGLIKQLEKLIPYNEEEAKDRDLIIAALKENDNLFSRENETMHMTASCWLVNRNHDRVLMCYHRIYDSWSWLGGHADGETDLLSVAIKEAKEESGLENISPVINDIYSCEVLTVNGHTKKGKYVPCHLHLNVTYLLEGDENEPLKIKADENSNLKWFDRKEALQSVSEKWMAEHIYTKLDQKLQKINFQKTDR